MLCTTWRLCVARQATQLGCHSLGFFCVFSWCREVLEVILMIRESLAGRIVIWKCRISEIVHELSLELGFWVQSGLGMNVIGDDYEWCTIFGVIDDNRIVFWIWDVVRVKLHDPEGELWNSWVGGSHWMREESGQNPVFHASSGGTKATARRDDSLVASVNWLVFWSWGVE